MKHLIQHDPPHPGEILLEFYLEPLGLSVTDAAKKLQINRSRLFRIINGQARISTGDARKLSKVFTNTPLFWLNLQRSSGLWNTLQK
ncbi:MAG TPA: HigA family addiction module antitoxin [Cyclobacteriaceae bacterium]|jgi:addiction module HigA family antidote|nr:HigA family addiction module antitoxin [Cyclobacteriaceae bacterium]